MPTTVSSSPITASRLFVPAVSLLPLRPARRQAATRGCEAARKRRRRRRCALLARALLEPRAHVAEIARPLPGASLQCSAVLRSRPQHAQRGARPTLATTRSRSPRRSMPTASRMPAMVAWTKALSWLRSSLASGVLRRRGCSATACTTSRRAAGAHSAHSPGPAAICTLNVVGSLVLGAVAGWRSPRASLLLGTGFCGAFTTFSTYSVDALTMLQQRNYPALAAYVIGNNVPSIGGAATGMRLGNAARSAVSLVPRPSAVRPERCLGGKYRTCVCSGCVRRLERRARPRISAAISLAISRKSKSLG